MMPAPLADFTVFFEPRTGQRQWQDRDLVNSREPQP
jgi:hypothetical protein